VSTKRLLGQRIKLAGFHVRLELTIPGLGIERRIPGPKRRKFIRRELFNLLLDQFNFTRVPP